MLKIFAENLLKRLLPRNLLTEKLCTSILLFSYWYYARKHHSFSVR
jgi:hypothetical protein